MTTRHRGRAISHPPLIDTMRTQPGEWVFIREYPAGSSTPRYLADRIKGGDYRYQPPGAYETRCDDTADGTAVYARYIGDLDATTPAPALVPPRPDVDRVLGQIARGEVSAGRAAARQIAARHEREYGDVWARPADVWDTPAEVWADPDTAWADGITAITTRKDVRP